MAKSRYVDTRVLRDPALREPQHYATWEPPDSLKGLNPADLLRGQQVFTHTWQLGDRMDKLASRYLGDDGYGWLICLVNGIGDPFGVRPGTALSIPASADVVLEQLGM